MFETETERRLALYLAGQGDVRLLRRTIAQYGGGEGALANAGLRSRLREGTGWASVAQRVEQLLAETAALGARWLSPGDPGFPAALADSDCVLLCVKGDIPVGPALAVVGSREADEYGLSLSRGLGSGLAAAGVTVVSGGARGIDQAAHTGCLESGGRTVVVLGAGLRVGLASPSGALLEAAAGSGAVVTEFLPNAAGGKWTFPDRNRIIARLGLATVVVQAAPKSGSLGTARLANELGRPVYAVPGDLGYPLSEGVNELLASGKARMLRHPQDLEAVLGRCGLGAAVWPRGQERGVRGSSTITVGAVPRTGSLVEHEGLLSYLQRQGASGVDELRTRFGTKTNEWLLELELGGLVVRDAEGRYRVG